MIFDIDPSDAVMFMAAASSVLCGLSGLLGYWLGLTAGEAKRDRLARRNADLEQAMGGGYDR